MQVEMDAQTRAWIAKRGGQVTIEPPVAAAG